MKKLILFLIAGLLFSTSAFAMAKKPDFNTKYGCYQRPYYECKQTSPWVLPTRANMEKWNECAQPIHDYCRATFG